MGVVVVGLILNLASSYVKPVTDKFWSKLSSRYRLAVELQNKKLADAVEEMFESPANAFHVKLDLIYHYCDFIFSVIITALGMWLSFTITQFIVVEGWTITLSILLGIIGLATITMFIGSLGVQDKINSKRHLIDEYNNQLRIRKKQGSNSSTQV